MPRFVVHHRHEPHECGIAFSAFKGHESPLRRRAALASCPTGDHAIWWTVEAVSAVDALALLPFFVAERSTAVAVREVQIP
jgi:hypothetical protein